MQDTSPETPLLSCEGLTSVIDGPAGPAAILHDVDFQISRSQSVGIVGESGAGKSMLIKTIMGLAPMAARVTGKIRLDGEDLNSITDQAKREMLGRRVGMVFQNPMTSLNPFVRVGRQIGEASRLHLGLGKAAARERAIDLLRTVGIPDPAESYDQFPHQFSGGMKQRIMIATALACEPDLLIADEATTALDVTVQKEILDLLQTIQMERRMAMILVTHNLGIVAGRTDEVVVMYGGRIVERGPTNRLFGNPRHRYTEALLAAIPLMSQPAHTRLRTIPGRPPNILKAIDGCPFAPRCDVAEDRCRNSMPQTTRSPDGRHSFTCYVPCSASATAAQADANALASAAAPS